MPKYQKTGRSAGRPKKHLEVQQCLGVRIPATLYAQLSQAAASQQATMAHVVTQALTHVLASPQQSALAGLVAKRDAALDMATDALLDIQGACDPCPQCSQAVDRILTHAWDKLRGPEQETA